MGNVMPDYVVVGHVYIRYNRGAAGMTALIILIFLALLCTPPGRRVVVGMLFITGYLVGLLIRLAAYLLVAVAVGYYLLEITLWLYA
jgi:hypothetical protein